MMIFQGKGSGLHKSSPRHHIPTSYLQFDSISDPWTNILYDACKIVSMDKLIVYLMKASKTFEGTTAEVSAQIGKQIDSDLMSLSNEKTLETADK
jgi:hypothetical protein